MTHSIDPPTQPPQSGATPVSTTPSTTDVAKDQAGTVASTAAQAGSQVASTAADQAKQVTQETKRQAQDLVQQGRQQVTQQVQQQVRTGQEKAGQGLSDIAQQLRTMVQGGGAAPSGPAADLVSQAGDKIEQLADWIAVREPGDFVVEVRDFARRRPGLFMFGAAIAGIVAGRLTTGVVAAHKDESSSGPARTGQYTQSATAPVPTYAEEGYAGTNYATDTSTAGYSTTGTTGSVPPPPYGTVPPAGTTSGFDDPLRTGEVGRP